MLKQSKLLIFTLFSLLFLGCDNKSNDFKTQQIEFSIFNMLGEKLNTLYSGNFEAGLHKTTVPVSSYAPGIYFIETKTENNLQIQKLIITK